jgi:hypothetical protein
MPDEMSPGNREMRGFAHHMAMLARVHGVAGRRA